ncbi:MAG: response regulator transcription factor [Eubacteriales bacterium]|nr:response regulator transcription factor [Eubacteriales bacterium]
MSGQKRKIFVIDDDVYIGDMLEEALGKAGYGVSRAYSGTEALLFLEKETPDLILLDLMLPGLSGEEIISKIRGIPVIVISAKARLEDKVKLLMDGACDYLTKPFEIRELLARIAVQLRKMKESGNREQLRVGNLVLDYLSHEVSVSGKKIRLTKTEFAILRLLMQNPGQAMAKSVILDRISEDTLDCTESSLKQHISNLRRKLGEEEGKEYIESVWGIGFRFADKKS